MTLSQIFEQYWYLFVIVVLILIFMLPSIPEDEIFTDDENSTDEEKKLLAQRASLVEKRNTLAEMSLEEYYEKAEEKTSFPEEGKDELTYVDRELLEELKSCKLRALRTEIDDVSKAFIEVKKPRITAEKLKEANDLEARARELKMNMNHHAQKEASSLLKKAKKIRKMYS